MEKDKQIGDLMKRFKKYNLAEKKGVLQLREFSKKEQQYEQLIRTLKRKIARYEAATNLDNSSQSSAEEAGRSDSEGFLGTTDSDTSNHKHTRRKLKSIEHVKERGVVLRASVMSAKHNDSGPHKLRDAFSARHSFDQKRRLIKELSRQGGGAK